MTNARQAPDVDWIAYGNSRYRLLARTWYADVEIFFAEGSSCWRADVLATNSTMAETEIADIAMVCICPELTDNGR